MDYKEAVKSAEDAVAGVQDPKLKEIAFAQILERLLTGEAKNGSKLVRLSGNQTKKNAAATRKGTKRKPGIVDWMRELAAEDFFKEPRTVQAMLQELSERGHHLTRDDISWPLRSLCEARTLRRKKIAPAEGKAPIWHWVNW